MTEPGLLFVTIIYYITPFKCFKCLVVGLMNKSHATVFLWVSAFQRLPRRTKLLHRGFCCFAHLGCHGTVHLVPCCHSGSIEMHWEHARAIPRTFLTEFSSTCLFEKSRLFQNHPKSWLVALVPLEEMLRSRHWSSMKQCYVEAD